MANYVSTALAEYHQRRTDGWTDSETLRHLNSIQLPSPPTSFSCLLPHPFLRCSPISTCVSVLTTNFPLHLLTYNAVHVVISIHNLLGLHFYRLCQLNSSWFRFVLSSFSGPGLISATFPHILLCIYNMLRFAVLFFVGDFLSSFIEMCMHISDIWDCK